MDRQSLESVGDWSCIESDGQDVGKKRTGIVSVVGAGGKTTVIRRLREECLAEKIPHIVSTTTHMQTGPE